MIVSLRELTQLPHIFGTVILSSSFCPFPLNFLSSFKIEPFLLYFKSPCFLFISLHHAFSAIFYFTHPLLLTLQSFSYSHSLSLTHPLLSSTLSSLSPLFPLPTTTTLPSPSLTMCSWLYWKAGHENSLDAAAEQVGQY